MTRHLTLAALVTAAAAAASLLSGAARPALLGAGIAAATAFASLLGFRLTGSGAKPVQRALAVFAAMFLARIVLVSLGLVAVHRMGESVVAFAVAFFVPYFVFAAIEGGYVHALGRQQGKPA